MNPIIYFDFDLMKAQRDKSKLVLVQRMVTRRGKTFPQGVWVSPSEVKKTDKVIGGQQNLLPAKGSIPKPQKGVWDAKYFESISQDKKDHSEAIAYLKECGVTWNEVNHPGINWMHALHARNLKFGSNSVSNTNTVNTPSQSTSQPSQATTQATQAVKPQPNKILSAMAKLDGKTLVEFQSCSNGKEKVIVLKNKLGQDGCLEFAKECGVTWNEHSNKGINSMRMSMALADAFDAEAGTTSYSGTKGKVGAPKGNQNAKKDGVTQNDEPKQEVKEPEEIEITDKMSDREKALAKMINGITSESDLKLFSKTGMVAEDDTAKEFIKAQLYKAYYSGDDSGSSGRKYTGYYSSYWGKSSVAYVSDAFKGVPKKLLRKGMEELARNNSYFNPATILYPRDSMALYPHQSNPNRDESEYNGLGIGDMLLHLTQFSQQSKEGQSEQGYTGFNLERINENLKDFGTKTNGVVSIINHIKDEDPELAVEADKMIDEYTTLLGLSYASPVVLNEIISRSYSNIKEISKNHETRAELYDAFAEKLSEIKKTYNMSDKDIYMTIENAYYGSNGSLMRADASRYSSNKITDSTGEVVTLKNLLDVDTWNKLDLYHDKSAANIVPVMMSTGKKYLELKENDSDGWGFSSHINDRDKSILLSTVTEGSYCTLQRQLLTFSGQKIQQYDSMTSQWLDVDTDLWSADEWDRFRSDTRYSNRGWRLTAKEPNPERDVIISNMKYAYDNMQVLGKIASNTLNDITPSAANHQGNMPEANFNYFRPQLATGSNQVKISLGSDSIKYTPEQANAKIKEQIDKIPVMSKKKIDEFRAYVESNGSAIDDISVKVRDASQYSVSSVSNISGHIGTPVHDLIYQQLTSIADYSPQMRTARVNTKEKVDRIIADKMNYTPFNSSPDSASGELKGDKLKQLRELTLSKVHCSLKTASSDERTKMETRVKHDWDKEKRDSSGNRLYGYISFKSNGVYQVNNSKASEVFSESVKRIQSNKPQTINGTSYESKVQSLFHGTDFKGACGILGVDGYFRAPKDGADAAKQGLKYAGGMLGPGVYLADLAGKSAGYFGNWGGGYGKRGALLVCDAILGDHLTAPDSWSVKNRMDVNSVSMRSGTHTGTRVLRADEWCVRTNDLVCPRYIIDAEAVSRNS